MHHLGHRVFLIAVAIFITACVPRLYIAFQPIPIQLQKTLPDDSYYYFLTAKNILAGNGPSVDGRNNSNGWHPLWLAINLGVFSLPFEDADMPVRVSLILGAIADSAVSVVLFLSIRRFLNESAAIVGAVIYALNSMPIMQSINGLETGLNALLLSLSLFLSIAVIRQPAYRSAIAWGIAYGLCFLARTDSALVLSPLGIFVLWNLPSEWRARAIVMGVLSALLVVTPWFVVNTMEFGSPLAQVSATAVPTAIRMRHELNSPDVPLWRLSWDTITQPNPWLRGDYTGTPVLLALPLWFLGVMGLYRTRLNTKFRLLWLACIAFIIGGLALIAVHTLVRWYPRPWYFVVNAQSLSICLAFYWFSLHKPKIKLATVTTVLPMLVICGMFTWRIGYYPWQNRQYDASVWLQEHSAPEVSVASMNSGIMGYYSGRTVVNLDGVVNPSAFNAIRNRSLMQYMRHEGVKYLIDFDLAIRDEYGPFMGAGFDQQIKEVAVLDEPYTGLGLMRIYEVLPSN